MAVRAVIFGWGGTLTPWHAITRPDAVITRLSELTGYLDAW